MTTNNNADPEIIEDISIIKKPEKDENGWTNLHIAAIENKIDRILVFIELWPNYINEEDIFGSTALHFAARWGHTRIVEVLIHHGANINAINHIGWSPLHCASWEGETSCVLKLLTTQNTTINCRSKSGWTPLHFAARWGYTETAEALLDIGLAQSNIKDNERQTAGHQAAIMGRANILHLLNDRKLLNLFDKTNEGKTIIDYALNNKKTFDFCVNMSNNYGLSFIQFVAIQNNELLFKKILKYHMHKSNAYRGIFPKNDFKIVGRLQEIDEMKQILQKNKNIVVRGVEGMGKTALIKYYAWTNKNYYQNNLYYINCQNEESFKRDIFKIAKQLKIPTKKYDTERDFKAITKDTFNNLKTKVGLLVFDNVGNIGKLDEYSQDNHEIDIIISGREPSKKKNCFDLKPLSEESAQEYFEHLFQDGLLKQVDRTILQILIREFKGLPQSLQLFKMQIMRRLFQDPQFNWSEYLDQVLNFYFKEFKSVTSRHIIYNLLSFELRGKDYLKDILNSLRFLNPNFISIKLLISLMRTNSNITEYLSDVSFLLSRSLLTVNDNYVEVNHYAYKLASFQGSSSYKTILQFICTHNYPEHCRNVFSYAQTCNTLDFGFETKLLEYLTTFGCFSNLKYLFEGKDKTYIMKYVKQYKLLHAAVKSGCIKTVELIYQFDNNIRRLNDKGHTMVWQAIEMNHTEVLDFLISKGASLQHADKLNKTPLHRAAFLGRVDIVKLLLSKGVDPNIPNKFLRTPLHYASMEGHNEVVQELFDHPKINIDARDHYRRSPVFETVRCYQLSTLRMFIEKGARIHTKDNLDLSPVRLAKLQKNRDEILGVFKEYGFTEDHKNEVCCPLLNIEIM